MHKKVINDIIVSKGYYSKFQLSKKELNQISNIIKNNFLENLLRNDTKGYHLLKKIDLKNYHKNSKFIDHSLLMQKQNRLLKPTNVLKIKKMFFFRKLRKVFSNFKIMNFENLFKEEIDWRIVRPNNNKDVSSLHRDEWFWSLNKKKIKKNCTRIKCWIPIICEKGRNGLKFVPKSHLFDLSVDSKNKRTDGLIKPGKIKKKMKVKIFKSNNGQAFIFNDKLMHGGAAGGKFTRVSLEFTLLVRNKHLKKYV